jgi:hypothetical protein
MIAHAWRKPSASGRVGRVALRPFRVAPVQLGLDERNDIEAVDPDVADLPVDVDILQPSRAAPRR